METKVSSLDHFIDDYLLCCMTDAKSWKTMGCCRADLGRFSQLLKREQLSQSVPETSRGRQVHLAPPE